LKLAQEVPEVDLVLGGHDHTYESHMVQDLHVLKSGTDFREYSLIDLFLDKTGANKKPHVNIKKIDITKNLTPDPEAEVLVDKYQNGMKQKLSKVLCLLDSEFDCRFSTNRTSETNIGNWVCDVMCSQTGADIAMINGGTVRLDDFTTSKEFTLGDLLQIFPYEDIIVSLEITGNDLRLGLENSVSKYPIFEGRFAQVSGVFFEFDPSKPSGNRITKLLDKHQKPIIPDQLYSLATKSYIADGKDGYDCFQGKRYIITEENGLILTTMIRNYISQLNTLSLWKSYHTEKTTLPKEVHNPTVLRAADKFLRKKHQPPLISPSVEGRIVAVKPQ